MTPRTNHNNNSIDSRIRISDVFSVDCFASSDDDDGDGDAELFSPPVQYHLDFTVTTLQKHAVTVKSRVTVTLNIVSNTR